MRKIDADALIAKIASLDRIAKTDSQKSLLGRVMYIISKMPTSRPKPVEPAIGGNQKSCWYYICPICQLAIDKGDKYCRHCGRKVKWDE